jgi:hypothetical protein
MDKETFGALIRRMMASDGMKMGERRRIYENDDILVVHSINDYPDGTREAVLMAMNVSIPDQKVPTRRRDLGQFPGFGRCLWRVCSPHS